jgi:hypothetical protein
MLYNRDISKPWRSGNICVKTHYGIWGASFFNSEPFDNSRLEWAIYRSKAWLSAAAEDRLFSDGDPFEFPDMPTKKTPTVGFLETEHNFEHFWSKTDLKNGTVRFKKFRNNIRILAVQGFREENTLNAYDWGYELERYNDEKALTEGLWFLLPKIPASYPWQIPSTWKELFSICSEMEIDLKQWIDHQLIDRRLFNHVTKLLLGFPVSENIGSHPTRLHWFCIELPKNEKRLNGFREGTKSYYQTKVKIEFVPTKKIQWMLTENWAKDQLTTRGNVSPDLQSKKILIIGCGAVGSNVSELLVRLGCSELTLVDKDIFSSGNASRHTLTMNSVNQNKSEELAKRLNTIFPTCRINFFNKTFIDLINSNPNFIEEFDVIMDLTAEDSVFKECADIVGETRKIFVSISLGLEAKRLFCYIERGTTKNSYFQFKEQLDPWLNKQKAENPNIEFPLEGIGCWHPVFPARLDDIMGVLAPSIRIIENFLGVDSNRQFVVIERQQNGDVKILYND